MILFQERIVLLQTNATDTAKETDIRITELQQQISERQIEFEVSLKAKQRNEQCFTGV